MKAFVRIVRIDLKRCHVDFSADVSLSQCQDQIAFIRPNHHEFAVIVSAVQPDHSVDSTGKVRKIVVRLRFASMRQFVKNLIENDTTFAEAEQSDADGGRRELLFAERF